MQILWVLVVTHYIYYTTSMNFICLAATRHEIRPGKKLKHSHRVFRNRVSDLTHWVVPIFKSFLGLKNICSYFSRDRFISLTWYVWPIISETHRTKPSVPAHIQWQPLNFLTCAAPGSRSDWADVTSELSGTSLKAFTCICLSFVCAWFNITLFIFRLHFIHLTSI